MIFLPAFTLIVTAAGLCVLILVDNRKAKP
jgi:hypothetical protein